MHRGPVLVLGMGAFFLAALGAVLALIYVIGGGEQRGVSLKNVSARAVVVRFEDGQWALLPPDGERTMSARREDYPQTITVTDASGRELFARQLQFRELSEMNFRLLIGDDGLVPLPTVKPERGIRRRGPEEVAA